MYTGNPLQFALTIHRLSLRFPRFEQFELANQLRRSSRSIVANLVEGSSRAALSGREQKRFLVIALGSKDETKLWLEMCKLLGYISPAEYNELMKALDEIGRMLYGLWKRPLKFDPTQAPSGFC
jgi:four helix bundle protein